MAFAAARQDIRRPGHLLEVLQDAPELHAAAVVQGLQRARYQPRTVREAHAATAALQGLVEDQTREELVQAWEGFRERAVRIGTISTLDFILVTG